MSLPLGIFSNSVFWVVFYFFLGNQIEDRKSLSVTRWGKFGLWVARGVLSESQKLAEK
jgi:hypothetical protein